VARYDETYEMLAARAIAQTEINIETMIRRMTRNGMSVAAIEANLLRDLAENGPIFGSFFRSMSGAAQSAVSVAFRQGAVAGDVLGDESIVAALERGDLRGAFDLASVLEDANPEALEAVEVEAADIDYTWIAASGNVCPLCLPLHGKTLMKSEWEELGYIPGEVHPGDWKSSCQCTWIPAGEAALHSDIVAPLRREKVKSSAQTTVRTYKRTARAVTQGDVEKSLAARDKAMQTPQGRRILRQLGQSEEGAKVAADTIGARRTLQGG